ncbi:GTP-binding protein SAR1B-like isoform X2 [Daphnia pulicaria]|nr:GTP-binding protein SAR1B-like isoform X2 [Daphnia pulicaria]
MLKNGTMGQHSPTYQPVVEEITIGKLKLMTFDRGGHQQARRVWRDYYPAVNALVFVIDACDKQRLPESKLELDLILSDELLKDRPVLILGNKVDLPGAASKQQLLNDLGLNHLVSGKDKTTHSQLKSHPVELYMCSILNRHGYKEGFEWLGQYID